MGGVGEGEGVRVLLAAATRIAWRDDDVMRIFATFGSIGRRRNQGSEAGPLLVTRFCARGSRA